MMKNFLFNKNKSNKKKKELPPWKLLIVDDEKDIHTVTTLALNNFRFQDRTLEFLHAHSAKAAEDILSQNNDIGMILLDVVMETDQAGLDLVKTIREDIHNSAVRIVLRTGQPGQAPEKQVIGTYDINDYKSKTELTSSKLYTVVCSGLRAYSSIKELEDSRKGLRKLIDASREISSRKGLNDFVEETFVQLRDLLNLDNSAVYTSEALAYEVNDTELALYKPGDISNSHLTIKLNNLEPEQAGAISESLQKKHNIFKENQAVLYCSNQIQLMVFYLKTAKALSEFDINLLNVFADNIKVILENIRLNNLIQDSQREMIYRLGEAVESRSNETGLHVKRVAHYSELLARLLGVSEEKAEILKYASPLHDIGKIAIPDCILNKPERLTDEEFEEIKAHTTKGHELLSGSNLLLMDVSATIALTHHEKWDGSGYPQGLAGENIDIYGRITALVDVFDALGSDRCYKKAWPLEEIIALIERERGKHFDPQLVDLFLENLDQFIAIRDHYKI